MNQCIYMVVNDKFTIGAEVTIYSFLKNNTWFNGDIIIGHGSYGQWGLSNENKERLSNLYYKIKFIEIDFCEFYDIYHNLMPVAQSGVGFEMSVYKFHAFRLSEYDKVVIFDTDMVIIDDVSELFDNDIEFGALHNVNEADYLGDTFRLREKEYFNCGVMVVGKKWLTEDVIIGCDRLLKTGEMNEEIEIPHFKGLYVEQDLLNVFFKDKDVTLIPKIYSANRFFCDDTKYMDVKIIHYLSYLKPWLFPMYKGLTQDVWFKYYNEYNDWLKNYTLILGDNKIKFPKTYEDKDKYLVVTCAKNENNYIREWIQHYLNLNFDKIIICDNNDDESLLEVISDYIESGVVEVFDCRGFRAFQQHVYSMFCSEGNYKWCGYFDCDEFLELNGYNDIKEYLKNKNEECIAFNWLLFDSNGEIEYKDDLLSNRFPQPYYPINNIENSFVKCIMKGGHFRYGDLINCGGHLFVCNDRNKITYNFGGYFTTKYDYDNLQAMLPLRYKEGYIKHYYTKSFDEWMQKSNRGWPDKKGEIKSSRFLRLNNKDKYRRERYSETLFLEDISFENLKDGCDFDDVSYYIYENINDYVYSFVVRIMYIMSKNKGKVFILTGKEVSDEAFNLLLECAYVTGNKIAISRNDDDIEHIYNKYGNTDGVIKYWHKKI